MPSRSSHVVHHSFLLTFSFSFLRHSAFRGFRGRDRRRGGTLIRRSLWVRYQPCASVERYKVSTYPHRTKESGPLEKKASKVWTLKKKTHPTLTETRLRSSDFYPHCLPTWSHHHLKIVCQFAISLLAPGTRESTSSPQIHLPSRAAATPTLRLSSFTSSHHTHPSPLSRLVPL